jgi:hypothetical protein
MITHLPIELLHANSAAILMGVTGLWKDLKTWFKKKKIAKFMVLPEKFSIIGR